LPFRTYINAVRCNDALDQDADGIEQAPQRGSVDHSTAGAQLVWQQLAGGNPEQKFCAQILALCIASHHSGLINCIDPDSRDNFTRRIEKPEEASHVLEAHTNADASVRERFDTLLSSVPCTPLIRLLKEILHPCNSKDVGRITIGLLVRFLFSCLIDADRVDTADFAQPTISLHRPRSAFRDWDTLIGRLEAVTFTKPTPIDAIRRQVSDNCYAAASRPRGIFTLTVPTGGAKTLSSLRFALHHAKKHGLERIFYVIPFTSIIDQNADVVRNILEPPGVVPGSIILEHHSNLTPERETWRTKLYAENWASPVIFTTTVQFLQAIFGAGTRDARRMHQLANAVIIFDEAQTVPMKCVHLFNNAINFLVNHCHSSVVLCTATQPLLNRVSSEKGAAQFSEADEIIPNVPTLFQSLRRTQIIYDPKSKQSTPHDVATLAAQEIQRTGSFLTVVNTRKAAQELYLEARSCHELANVAVYHLSTAMCPAHRRKILADIRYRLSLNSQHGPMAAPTLCVSTQLIEAGVDVDFGSAARYLAGLVPLHLNF
jgi:CRISPR-associated endonuclease/helicase Cas3